MMMAGVALYTSLFCDFVWLNVVRVAEAGGDKKLI